jgi:TonB family protein
MCLASSIVTTRDQFGSEKHVHLSNLTIDLVMPEPVKLPESKTIEQATMSAALSSSLGRRAIDKPVSGPPVKPVVSQPKVLPNQGQKTATLPPITSPIKAAAAPVVVVKTTESLLPQPKPVTPVPAQAQIQAPVTTNSATEQASVGSTLKENGAGGADANAGTQGGGTADNGKGLVGQQIAMAIPHSAGIGTAMGNIAPYRKDMLMRLATHWNPKKLKQGNIVVVITLSKDGQLLNSEIVSSSGNDKLDQYALDAVGKTEFAPLPDWYRGSQLRLKVELARVEAMKSDI